jgi:mono/diheme cytochrome c family protein
VTTNEIILAVVCAVLVVFSLTVSLVVPKRNPDFPGRKGLAVFFSVAALLVIGMLAAVELIGEEEGEAAEVAEPAEPAPAEPPAEEPPAEEPAPAEEPPAEEPAPAPAEEPPAEEPAGDPAAGKEVFASAGCSSCHTLADAGASGSIGPNLDDAKPSFDLVVDRVTNGQGGMPSFSGQLSEQQIQDVAAYVVQATSG